MEVRAHLKSVRISPRKVRVVADEIRNLSIDEALGVLEVLERRAGGTILKLLKSAIANAQNNAKLSKDNLEIAKLDVTEAPSFKRFHASTRGRVHPYKRRGSHITIVLKEKGDK